MKLQIGSSVATGRYKQSEWINLDIEYHQGVDIVANAAGRIPLGDNTIDEIHCIHVLEHVTRDKYSIMLEEMYRVLKPEGVVYIETPDFYGTVQLLASAFVNQDTTLIHKWTTSIYGKNERPGMAHHWGFYDKLLYNELSNIGFKNIKRLTDPSEMISSHYKQEPVLLMRGVK